MRFSVLRAAALLPLLALTVCPSARADVRLPGLISENMVLQQKTPVRIWGWADPGERVAVAMQGQSVSDTAGGDGRWSVTLRPLRAGGPFPLRISGKNAIDFQNVLVGEVWVCSGQSNMEWPLGSAFEADKHVAAAANPRIRLFSVPHTRADAPKDDVAANWEPCTPETVRNFSAVGYFFGRDLEKARGVPIGLIDSSWGGTPAEAWTRRSALQDHSELRSIAEKGLRDRTNWRSARIEWTAASARAKAAGQPAPREPGRPWMPGELYNGMIAPLLPYAIQGVLWYQGESNAGNPAQYRTLFPFMIETWRRDWGRGDFPFLLVQLAPFMARSAEPQESGWAELREAQQRATTVLPNVGMAVITDVGEENDIHPRKKEPVGARLALLARRIAYREKIVASGPTFKSMTVDGNRAFLRFDNVGSGLVAEGGGSLTGFAVWDGEGRDSEGRWDWANAEIVGRDTVVVSAPGVERPATVRYGWANFPVVNLWNREGLPAVPFRTDAPK